MEYQWIGMDTVPPIASIIPIERDAYIKDMQLTGEQLSQQVLVDTPRACVYLQGIKILSGLVLEEFVRYVLDDRSIADAVLALSTQTVLAAPMRSLSVCLAPKELYLAECEERRPLTVKIELAHDWARVFCEKDLQLVRVRPTVSGISVLRTVTISVEYDSREPYVVVDLKTKKKR